MPDSILVATPHTAFGELLRISLEESGQYRVRLVQSAKEARAACDRAAVASRGAFLLAIIDSDIRDEAFVSLCFDMLELQPGIRMVVIPPQNNPNHPSLGGLMPHGYLNRPFYLPDLLDTVARLLSDREKQLKTQALPAGDQPTAEAPSTTIPLWLQDTQVMSKYLNQELAHTQAMAALLGTYGALPDQNVLRTSAGRLDPAAAQELAFAVLRYWKRDEKADLMRFIRLPGHKKDYLVYATQVIDDLILILVYDADTALSQVRPQTRAMAQSLAGLHPQRPSQQEDSAPTAPPAVPASREPVTQMDDHPLSGYTLMHLAERDEFTARTSDPNARIYPLTDGDENAEADDEFEGSVINLSALLGSIPDPDPREEPARVQTWSSNAVFPDIEGHPIPGTNGSSHPEVESEWQPEQPEPSPVQRPAGQPVITQPMLVEPDSENLQASPLQKAEERLAAQGKLPGSEVPAPEPLSPAASPNLPAEDSLPLPPPPDYKGRRSASTEAHTEPPMPTFMGAGGIEANSTAPTEPKQPPLASEPPVSPQASAIEQPFSKTELEPEPPVDPLGDTRPRVISGPTHLSQLEPASAAISLLTYTCVLVPRLPQHYLTGELVERLYGWVQQLCLAFGWRLEGISIRPEYLQWSLQVAPSISPGNIVRIIRQRTSMHIFHAFPSLSDENPSGDFWAIGYLIVSGTQPPSAQLMREFIAQTRKRQGILK